MNMDNFNRTGVYLSDEEADEILDLVSEARRTPVILVGNVNMSASAWKRAHQKIYALALEAGLPEIEGYYGFDPEAREFLEPA